MMVVHKKRGRSSRTEIQAAYEQGRKDASSLDIKAAEQAGFQRAFDLLNQAMRFIRFESMLVNETMPEIEHPTSNVRVHRTEVGPAPAVSGSGFGDFSQGNG